MNIYDVSQKAGVSIATVSRVLNGNPNVSDSTRQKVLTVMKDIGYTPNVFARGLGEYGATSMVSGYTPGRTATISTTVYQLWREGNDALAYQWAGINILLSFVVLIVLNFFERRIRESRWPVGHKEV